MKKILFLSVIMLTVFTFSCASKSDYQQNNFEIAKLKNDSKRLHNDMVLFKKAYNPELQEVFTENILAAEQYRKSIDRTKNDIENISDKIHFLLRESENDRMLISENLKTATAENIVNEFRQLNIEWDTTIFELSNLITVSEKAVDSSHNAAMQAAEKAGSAEQAADYIAEYVNLINRQTRSLSRIQDKIKTLDIKIRKISTRLDEMDKPESNKRNAK